VSPHVRQGSSWNTAGYITARIFCFKPQPLFPVRLQDKKRREKYPACFVKETEVVLLNRMQWLSFQPMHPTISFTVR